MSEWSVRAANSTTDTPFGSFYEGQCIETLANPWKFTGQWQDVEIDQYHLRARQYDPTMMRFTSRDPVKGKYREPLTLHKYLYCLNDPINLVDPDGETAKTLLAPVIAGHATHTLAITVAAYGVATMNWNCIDLGILIDQSIAGVMAGVATGKGYWDSLIHAVRDGQQKNRDNFGKLKDIGKDYGKTLEEVRDAIHRNKRYYRPDGGDLTEEEIREILDNL